LYQLAIIIDDDPISILVCETLLKKTKFAEKVMSFQNGNEGLKFLKNRFEQGEGLPDIIFLDVLMPLMSGWEFLEAYEQLDSLPEKKAHVMMLSAAFDPADRKKAETSPLVTDFISKPITTEILLGMMAENS
jgi:CheY-like chemotaxis protein